MGVRASVCVLNRTNVMRLNFLEQHSEKGRKGEETSVGRKKEDVEQQQQHTQMKKKRSRKKYTLRNPPTSNSFISRSMLG